MNETKHYLYNTWKNMRQRCLNSGHPQYYRYGGRGITIDETWNNFWQFVEDMGERPKGYSLDRIDNEGNYEPSNCRWATAKQNASNRTIGKTRTLYYTHKGQVKTVKEWAALSGVNYDTLRSRLIRYNWSMERATEGVYRMSEIKEILGQRGSRYGTIEQNAHLCQGLLEIVSKSEQWEHLSEVHREVIHMIFHKLSRMISGDQWYDDNSIDVEGYARLLTEYIQEHNS